MLKLLFGDPNTRKLKRYQPIVEEINFLEEEISQLTDDELRKETQNLKSNISSELDIKKQKELLEYVIDFINANKVSPSYDEIREAMNLKSKSGYHIKDTVL